MYALQPVARAAALLVLIGASVCPLPALAAESPSPTVAPMNEPDGYLVAPFENRSGVKNLDWMSSALAMTLAERLETLPQHRPAYGAGVLDGWPARIDDAVAAARAREAGARFVYLGSYSRPNWKAELTLRVLLVPPVDGGPPKEVASATRSGERDELFGLLDAVIDQVFQQRGVSLGAPEVQLLHRRPTRDLYAFTLFGRSLNLFFGIGGEKNDEQAQKILTRTTFIDPKFAEAHRALGFIDLARGDQARAAGQYAHALDLKPGYYPAIVGLAELYRAEGKKQPARDMADKALELRPWDVEMRLLLGTLELEAGELDKALADLQKVCAVQPRLVQARRTLAMVYSARGEIPELIDELARIAELVPEDSDVRLDLGAAYMRLGRYDKALATYQEVLQKKPRHVQALKFTGDLYRRLGDPKKAVDVYERVRRLVPEDPRAYFLLGAAYAEAGNDAKALAILEDAQQFKGYQGEAWADLGALHLRRGDLNRAQSYLTRAVARSPMRPKAHFNYALLLDATQQRDKALTELKLASDLDPEDADCRYLSGVILLRLGRLDEAKAEFAAAVRLKPSHVDARHNLDLLQDLDRRYGAEHAGVGAR